jgi:hypothetical protein
MATLAKRVMSKNSLTCSQNKLRGTGKTIAAAMEKKTVESEGKQVRPIATSDT